MKGLTEALEKFPGTKSDVARLCGVNYHHVRRLEKGASTPSFDLLVKLSLLLSVSLDDLVWGHKGRPEIRKAS